jgi:hypothetical protein
MNDQVQQGRSLSLVEIIELLALICHYLNARGLENAVQGLEKDVFQNHDLLPPLRNWKGDPQSQNVRDLVSQVKKLSQDELSTLSFLPSDHLNRLVHDPAGTSLLNPTLVPFIKDSRQVTPHRLLLKSRELVLNHGNSIQKLIQKSKIKPFELDYPPKPINNLNCYVTLKPISPQSLLAFLI